MFDGSIRVEYRVDSHDRVSGKSFIIHHLLPHVSPWWRHQIETFSALPYWPFVRGIHRYPVNSPHKGQWRRPLVFSLICARINDWVNTREAGDLRRRRAHYASHAVMTEVDKAVFALSAGLRPEATKNGAGPAKFSVGPASFSSISYLKIFIDGFRASKFSNLNAKTVKLNITVLHYSIMATPTCGEAARAREAARAAKPPRVGLFRQHARAVIQKWEKRLGAKSEALGSV